METFDIIVLSLAIVAFIAGFLTGLVMQLAILAGVVLGSVFSGELAAWLSPVIGDWIGGVQQIVKPLSYIISFFIIVTLSALAGRLLQSVFKAVKINVLNRLLGGFSGLLSYVIILGIVVNIIEDVDKKGAILTDDIREKSVTYSLIKEVATTVVPYLRFDRAGGVGK